MCFIKKRLKLFVFKLSFKLFIKFKNQIKTMKLTIVFFVALIALGSASNFRKPLGVTKKMAVLAEVYFFLNVLIIF